MTHRLLVLLPAVCLASCAATAPHTNFDLAPSALSPEMAPSSVVAPSQEPMYVPVQRPTPPPPTSRPVWMPGQPLLQGFLGVSYFENVSVEDSGSGEIDGDKGDLDQLPLIGGGGQWKLAGQRVDFGIEGMFSFGWRGNAEAFVVGGGGAAVAVDVDLMLFELYGGPFVSMFLGDKTRLYGAAGPVMQWADYDQSGGGTSESGSGFGSGLYARAGIEFMLPSRTLIGFGARWSDTTVDLDNGLGDLEIDGLQLMLTVSRGI